MSKLAKIAASIYSFAFGSDLMLLPPIAPKPKYRKRGPDTPVTDSTPESKRAKRRRLARVSK